MAATFLYNKLVRDNIPRFHKENGHTINSVTLKGAELRKALCDKLHEESDEVSGATTKEELTEEIADVRQILDDLCATEGISEQSILDVQSQKATKKGGFKSGQFVTSVTMDDESDKWVIYCRTHPDKYPEVK